MRGEPRISQASHAFSSTSPPQEPDLVELDGPVGFEERQEDGEADRRLRGRDGDCKEGEHLARRVPGIRGERDEIQDRGVQDDLDGHQHDDRILADENPVQPDAKETHGEDQLVLDRDHGFSSIFARYTPPIIALDRRRAIRMSVIAYVVNMSFATEGPPWPNRGTSWSSLA